MKVSRDLDKPRRFKLGSGEYEAQPGEDLFYNRKTGQYELRNVVGGGRSAGRGGLTAEELRDIEEEGITTERKIKRGDYGKPGRAPTEPTPKTKGYAKGGVTRADGCARKGHTKGKMR